MRRRGQMNLPFHLALTLIGGGLLFLVLVIFAMRILEGGEADRISSLTFRLENEFRFGATETDLFKVLEVPRDGFELVCSLGENDTVDEAHIRINKAAYAADSLLYLPVFSAANLKGPSLHVWAKRWMTPMSIGTLLYVDDRWTRFVIVTNGQSWIRDMVKKLSPYRVSVITPGELSSFERTGDARYRFVLFGGALADVPHEFREDSSAVLIASTDRGESGAVSFYDDIAATIPSFKTEYQGKPLLYAAIFAGDSEIYRCNLGKAERMMEITVSVLKEKALILKQEAGAGMFDTECVPYYDESLGILDEFARLGLIVIRVDSPAIAQIERMNAGMKSRGCPTLY